jgi:DMATS type aromatic prenyltransferase
MILEQPCATPAGRGLAGMSYAELSVGKMLRACQALGWAPAERQAVAERLTRLLEPWGRRPASTVPYRSFLANDGMPVELSFAWNRHGSEVRAYVECLGDPPTLRSCQDAGGALIRRLGREPGVSLSQYLAIEDLFAVPDPGPPFSIWIGAAWERGEQPWYKVFLNPQVRGRQLSTAVVAEAMGRLGLGSAWTAFREHLGRPDFAAPASELGIFCLDLRDPGDARVRVYLRHAGATADTLEHVAACAQVYQPGAFERVCNVLTGHAGPYLGKPPVTTIAFRAGEPVPTSVTLDIPLDPNFPSDAEAQQRVSMAMLTGGIDPAGYLATLHALADRPLTQSSLQSWFAYRPGPLPRMTVYFSTLGESRDTAE